MYRSDIETQSKQNQEIATNEWKPREITYSNTYGPLPMAAAALTISPTKPRSMSYIPPLRSGRGNSEKTLTRASHPEKSIMIPGAAPDAQARSDMGLGVAFSERAVLSKPRTGCLEESRGLLALCAFLPRTLCRSCLGSPAWHTTFQHVVSGRTRGRIMAHHSSTCSILAGVCQHTWSSVRVRRVW